MVVRNILKDNIKLYSKSITVYGGGTMKKDLYKVFLALSISLIAVFIVLVIFDYVNYNPYSTSAPFSANILLRSIQLLLPSFVFFCIGLINKKKNK